MPARRNPGGRPDRGGGPDRGGRSPGSRARPAGGGANRPAGGGANRPAGVRRPVTGGAAKRTRAPQPRGLTGRAAVLGMVLLGLLLAYAYPVRVYLAQKAEIAALELRQQDQRRRIAGLAEERAKWDDEEYVKAKARKELHYVLPGETPFIPLPDPAQPGAPAAAQDRPAAPEPWYRKLWSSVDAADRPSGP